MGIGIAHTDTVHFVLWCYDVKMLNIDTPVWNVYNRRRDRPMPNVTMR